MRPVGPYVLTVPTISYPSRSLDMPITSIKKRIDEPPRLGCLFMVSLSKSKPQMLFPSSLLDWAPAQAFQDFVNLRKKAI